jgi:hypothetical protein
MEAILTGLVTGVKWNPFASREGRERKRESEREREREREALLHCYHRDKSRDRVRLVLGIRL